MAVITHTCDAPECSSPLEWQRIISGVNSVPRQLSHSVMAVSGTGCTHFVSLRIGGGHGVRRVYETTAATDISEATTEVLDIAWNHSGANILSLDVQASTLVIQCEESPFRTLQTPAADNTTWVSLDPGSQGTLWEEIAAPSNRLRLLSCVQTIEAKIDRFLKLPEGWDGDNGIAPSQAAGHSAKVFLTLLKHSELPHEIHAIGDGEIVFQWRKEANFIEAAFDGETLSWYARTNEEAPIYGDELFDPINPIAGQRLMQAIERIV